MHSFTGEDFKEIVIPLSTLSWFKFKKFVKNSHFNIFLNFEQTGDIYF